MKLVSLKPIELKDFLMLLFVVIGGGIALIEYGCNARREFKKPLQQKQLEIYQEASSAAASLATIDPGSDDWKKSKTTFYRLYYGPMAMLEDFRHTEDSPRKKQEITVEQAMIVFHACLDDKQCLNACPGAEKCDYSKQTLENLSLGLAHTCRRSLGTDWGMDIKQLNGDYQKISQCYWNRLQNADIPDAIKFAPTACQPPDYK